MNKMKEEREIVCFDIETTGFSFKDCGIVQFAAIIMDQDLNIIQTRNIKINPGDVHWSQSAIDATGIDQEAVKDCPKFKDVAESIYNILHNRDIITHNGNRFDIPFIIQELEKHNYILDLSDIKVYDTFVIESKINSRKLGDLFKKYYGSTMEENNLTSHDALSDTQATIQIFKSQKNLINLNDIDSKVSMCKELMIKDGITCLGIGKYRTESVIDVIKKDPDYIVWLITNTKSKALFKEIQDIYKSI